MYTDIHVHVRVFVHFPENWAQMFPCFIDLKWNIWPDLWPNPVVTLAILLLALLQPRLYTKHCYLFFPKACIYICMNQTFCDQIYIILPNHTSLLKIHLQGINTFSCIWTYVNIINWRYSSLILFWVFPILFSVYLYSFWKNSELTEIIIKWFYL